MRIIDRMETTELVCPRTGETILEPGESVNEDVASLMGYWHSDTLQEPSIRHPVLMAAWQQFVDQKRVETSSNGDADESGADSGYGCNVECTDCPTLEGLGWEELEAFLREFEQPNWVVYAITDTADHSTAWFVIDGGRCDMRH